MLRTFLCLVAASLAWMQAAQAWAQTAPAADPQRAEAREDFVRGVEAARHGQWDAALEAFTRSYRQHPSPATLLNVAGCEVHLGHLVSARRNYLALLAGAEPGSAHLADVERMLGQLEARIPHLRVDSVEAHAGDALRLDGTDIPLTSQPLPIDPGAHVVELRRDDQALVERRFSVAERELFVLDLAELCRFCPPRVGDAGPSARGSVSGNPPTGLLSAGRPAAALAQPAAPDAASPSAARAVDAPARYSRAATVLPWTALSLGAGALVSAAIVGPLALAQDRSLAQGCGKIGTCQAGEVRRADRLALGADVGLGVGISLAVAAGVGFWLRKPRAFEVTPLVQTDRFGVTTRVLY